MSGARGCTCGQRLFCAGILSACRAYDFLARPAAPMASVDVAPGLVAYFQRLVNAVHARDSQAAIDAFVPLLRYANGAQPQRHREDT